MRRFEEQYPDFIKYEQYLGRLFHEDLGVNTVNFTKGYLTPEEIITLLVIESPDISAQRKSRRNVLADQYSVMPDRLFLPLTTVYQPTMKQRYQLGTQIDAYATYPNMDHALIALLKSFWLLYDAICKPQAIQYKQDEKETIIEENNLDKLTITISPHQTNPLIFLLIDIYTRYQKLKDIKQLKNNIFYYKKLNGLVKKLEGEKNLDKPEIILGRIKTILKFLSDTIKQFYEKNHMLINSEAAVSEALSDSPKHSPRFMNNQAPSDFNITPVLSTLSTPGSSAFSSPTTLSTPESSYSDLNLPGNTSDERGALSSSIENTFFRKPENREEFIQSSLTDNDKTTFNPQGSAS